MCRVCVISCAVVSLILSGCSSIPDPSDIPDAEPYDVIQRIRCELSETLLTEYEPSHWMHNANVGFVLEFTTTVNNNQTGQLVGTWPIHLGTFSLQLDGGAKRERIGTTVIKFSETISPSLDKACSAVGPSGITHFYPITGNIGISKIVDRFVKVRDIGGEFAAKDPYYQKLDFTLTFNGGVKPSFSIVDPVTTNRFTGNINFTADRSDQHTLNIAFLPPEKKAQIPNAKLGEKSNPVHITIVAPGKDDAEPFRNGGDSGRSIRQETQKEANKRARKRIMRFIDRERSLDLEGEILNELRESR